MCKHKMIVMGILEAAIAAIVVSFILGCTELRTLNPSAGEYEGPSRDMGEGSAHAFVTLDADGWEYVLSLPKEALISGYDHIVIDWNPKGHIPIGVYDAPHFDFHFYLISPEQREKITAKGEDASRAHKTPSPELMPEGYILPEGTEVPRMGAHAIDTTAPEFNKLPFVRTFIYGFYDGQMIFLEPMMTEAFLATKPNTTDQIRLPKAFSKDAYYPTIYSVKYNANQREYEVSLENLVYK